MKNPQRVINAGGSRVEGSAESLANSAPARAQEAITFTDYVLSDEFAARWGTDPDADFRARLARADVRGLPGLLRWVRERYPDYFYRRGDNGTGKVALRRVWADYLRAAGL